MNNITFPPQIPDYVDDINISKQENISNCDDIIQNNNSQDKVSLENNELKNENITVNRNNDEIQTNYLEGKDKELEQDKEQEEIKKEINDVEEVGNKYSFETHHFIHQLFQKLILLLDEYLKKYPILQCFILHTENPQLSINSSSECIKITVYFSFLSFLTTLLFFFFSILRSFKNSRKLS